MNSARSWGPRDEPELRLTKRGEYVVGIAFLIVLTIALGIAGGIQWS